MTVNVLARFHRATENIEAVDYNQHNGKGGYQFAVRFLGGKHNNAVVRCHTALSAIRLFDQAVAARKQGLPLWWLGD